MNKTGTGLGLSICKNIIEKMGGTVKVESEGEGKGTTFILQLSSTSLVEKSDLPLDIQEAIINRQNRSLLAVRQ